MHFSYIPAKIFRPKCFPAKTPGIGGKMRDMNILSRNEYFNSRLRLWAFWWEMVILTGNVRVRDRHFWREMCNSAGKHFGGKIQAVCIFRIFSPKLSAKMRAMSILAGNEHLNRRYGLWAFLQERFLAENCSSGKLGDRYFLAGNVDFVGKFRCWRGKRW